jgi:hypothetical protein
MYFIESGEATVEPGGRDALEGASTLSSGDFFGQVALLTDGSYRATVRAATDMRLWALDKVDFDEVILRHPLLALSLSRSGPTEGEKVEPPAPERPAPSVGIARERPGRARHQAGDLLNRGREWFTGQSRATQVLLVAALLLLIWVVCVSVPLTIASALRNGQAGQASITPSAMAQPSPEATARAAVSSPTERPSATSTPLPVAVRTSTPRAIPPTAVPTSTPSPTPPHQGRVMVNGLRLRAGPGFGWVVRTHLAEGDLLRLLARDEESTWLKVETAEGLEGWTSAQFVEVGLPLAALPVLTPTL